MQLLFFPSLLGYFYETVGLSLYVSKSDRRWGRLRAVPKNLSRFIYTAVIHLQEYLIFFELCILFI